MKRYGSIVSTALAALMVVMSGPAFCGQRELLGELRSLVDQEDEAFLITEIGRVQPFYAIRRLARFQQTQDRVGGGFCGCLPGQLMNADEIPLPVDDIGVLETAVFLAEQRKSNQGALLRLGCPVVFSPMPLADAPLTEAQPHMTLHIDWAVPAAFLDALADGVVTMDEGREIAHMPANQEMLRSVCARREGAGPWVTEQTLAYLIWKAGSSDPLDRLWRWCHPMNDFGYADLAVYTTGYRQLITGLQVHHQNIADAAMARIAPFFPPDREIAETFALTVSCLISDWATPAMSGANVLQIKSGWEGLVQRISGAVYRQQLLKHCSNWDGTSPETTDDLLRAGLTDERYEVFHEMIAYAILEGAVDYVSSPAAPIDETSAFKEGATLFDNYVIEVIRESDVDAARTLFEQGQGVDGPLCALGRHMAQAVEERDGPQAVTALLEQGSVAFFEQVLEIDSDNGGGLFNQNLLFVLRDLSIVCLDR